jgi:hypothetical protein
VVAARDTAIRIRSPRQPLRLNHKIRLDSDYRLGQMIREYSDSIPRYQASASSLKFGADIAK